MVYNAIAASHLSSHIYNESEWSTLLSCYQNQVCGTLSCRDEPSRVSLNMEVTRPGLALVRSETLRRLLGRPALGTFS
jgi:hypothetical protein